MRHQTGQTTKKVGELRANGRWEPATAYVQVPQFYNIEQPVVVMTRLVGLGKSPPPASVLRWQKCRVVGDDMIQAKNKYSEMTPQTMRTG